MGDHRVNTIITKANRAAFIDHLLKDVAALEIMLQKKYFEENVSRIGAEQEFCIVNNHWRPSKRAEEILTELNDRHFTTELARYNLEINLDPVRASGACFSTLEKKINEYLAKVRKVASTHRSKIILTGILPTITKKELSFDYLTPTPRYSALNDMMKELRGTDFELHIKGVDELTIIHDSVLFEACNTSFQMHLQINPADFIASYNWAQAIAGPVLGVCANSPLLLGRELWNETRIALFQQSIDIRSYTYALKDQQARVTFSNAWASGTAAELFKNDIAQHKIILTKDIQTSSLDELRAGKIPKLSALTLHNSTIYRWNRPCYGISKNGPHLRIENRYIPAGPTVVDEVANFAFWAGLMKGRPSSFDSIATRMDFRDAKSNFVKAARNGRDSIMVWEGKAYTTPELITRELLPIANEGLMKLNISSNEREKYLSIIEARANSQTGATWSIQNYRNLRQELRPDDALISLTRNMHKYQEANIPVHRWPAAKILKRKRKTARLLGHIMSTRLFTVHENDIAALAIRIMQWKNIHHVPVENRAGQLTGMLTWTHMEQYSRDGQLPHDAAVADIMIKKLIIGTPDMSIRKAVRLMKSKKIGCLPIIQNDHLVGIATIRDVMDFGHD